MTNVIEPPRRELPPPVGQPVGAATTTDRPAPGPSPAYPPLAQPEPPRRHGPWHVIAIIVGSLALLPSLGMLAGGIAVVTASGVSDGYFDVDLERVESDGVAVAAVDVWDSASDDSDRPWVLDWLDPDLRVQATTPSGEPLFIGIAATTDVQDYLAGSRFHVVVDFENRRPVYSIPDGSSEVRVEPPAEQTFWMAQASGTGEQTVEWNARTGDWTVVVMNADGSPGVAADVTVGVHSDAVLPIGIVLIVFGAIGLLGSVTLIVVGARGRRP